MKRPAISLSCWTLKVSFWTWFRIFSAGLFQHLTKKAKPDPEILRSWIKFRTWFRMTIMDYGLMKRCWQKNGFGLINITCENYLLKVSPTVYPVRKPRHLWRGGKKKKFIHYLPRRGKEGLILVFARPLVFRSAAKARNPYTHGVKGGAKAPTR